MVFNTSIKALIEKSNHIIKKSSPYPLYEKDANPYAHIEVSKCVIISNEETNDYHIFNLFRSIFKNIVFEWGEIFVKDHHVALLQRFNKSSIRIVKRNKQMNKST
jgi:hypothetical protein